MVREVIRRELNVVSVGRLVGSSVLWPQRASILALMAW